MSKHYAGIAFTDAVQDVQERYGSRAFYGKKAAEAVAAQPAPDPLGPGERAYLAETDGFFLASVSETGWPYVQHRGGPPGFVQVLDEHTIGWADFRGNLQHVTDGNVSQDPRVSLIVMDYAHQRRLKIFGHARIVYADDDPDLVARLTHTDYDAVVERAVVVTVDAFDWNCPQHITPRYTVAELEPMLAPLRVRLETAEAEVTTLRRELAAVG